jgi:uncharacterized membrane protein YeaQ/YmgE (transglycosylase-associated protein family)
VDGRSIIGWILIGLIAGAIGRFLLPGRDPMGCFGTIAVGILGSFLGGALYSFVKYHQLVFHPTGLIGSVVGAMVLLLVLRLARGRT